MQDLSRLEHLCALKQQLDTSSHETPSAKSLRALALTLNLIDAAHLKRIRCVGTGAFADVDMCSLVNNDFATPTDSAAPLSTASSRVKRRARGLTVPMPFRRSSEPTIDSAAGLRSGALRSLVVVKYAKAQETLEPFSLAPDERKAITLPASVAINLHAEAVLLHSLRHDNIVSVLGVTELEHPVSHKCVLGIVQEFLPGGTLLHRITAGKYSQHAALGWLVDIARALRFLHEGAGIGIPIAHRDIKPENVLIDEHGRAKLVDFGLFRFIHAAQPTGSAAKLLPVGVRALRAAITTGQTGSNRYMAPENFRNAEYTHKVDVFSFAVVAWEVLMRKRAYADLYLTADQVAEGVATRGLRPPLPLSWPRQQSTLLAAMWAAEASDRPELAFVLKALEELQEAALAKAAKPPSLVTSAIARFRRSSA
ncbi:hypothetical protein KFE25_009266 [Diacronema lutheri]|uniref:Protein kinase domain-containing protein n=1 Tax=Diacronema lutheri TaxID=2081491 RepID=A0A8J5Y3G9_DIALT|nr:hypothetical protein KFE25_009266 [Diacronema lutheri]